MIAKKRAQNRYTMGYVLAFLDISKRILVYQSSITTTFAGISLSLRVTSLPISAIVYPHSGTYKFRFGNAVFRYLYGNILGRFSRVYSRFLCLLYAETIIPTGIALEEESSSAYTSASLNKRPSCSNPSSSVFSDDNPKRF